MKRGRMKNNFKKEGKEILHKERGRVKEDITL